MPQPVEQGMQGGVPANQEAQNTDPFAPSPSPAASIPVEPQPIPVGMGIPEADVIASREALEAKPVDDNDNKRYQYWQGEAAKRDNALQAQAQQNQALTQQNAQMMQMLQNQQVVQEPIVEAPKPPEAPLRPNEPRGYNREDALTDPKSVSSQHLDDIDTWRNDMDVYNRKTLDFDRARMAEGNQAIQYNLSALQQEQALQAQYAQAKQLVQTQHGLSVEQADEFVRTYADPNNVTMDNLIAMYKTQNGIPMTPQPVQQAYQPIAQPSPSFQQVQRAQQLAPPMGVMPAQADASIGNMGASFMKAITGQQIDTKIFGV